MNDKLIFVVTGANKGIGYAIVRGLAKQVKGATIYLTARNVSLGEEALKRLCAELGPNAQSEVRFHQLDVASESSCAAFTAHLKKEHGSIDVLVNNAGIGPEIAHPFPKMEDRSKLPLDQMEATIAVNYGGVRRMADALIPLIRPGGRIVNVCSQGGMMSVDYAGGTFTQHIPTFDRPDFPMASIDAFLEGYKRLVREGKSGSEGGYPESVYRLSKVAAIALSVLQSRELESRRITVHPCCPGYVDTDLTQHKGPLNIDQGADTPIWLATAEGVPNGQFVLKRKVRDWLRGTEIDLS